LEEEEKDRKKKEEWDAIMARGKKNKEENEEVKAKQEAEY